MEPARTSRRREDSLYADTVRPAQGREFPYDSLHWHFVKAPEPELTFVRRAKERVTGLDITGRGACGHRNDHELVLQYAVEAAYRLQFIGPRTCSYR